MSAVRWSLPFGYGGEEGKRGKPADVWAPIVSEAEREKRRGVLRPRSGPLKLLGRGRGSGPRAGEGEETGRGVGLVGFAFLFFSFFFSVFFFLFLLCFLKSF